MIKTSVIFSLVTWFIFGMPSHAIAQKKSTNAYVKQTNAELGTTLSSNGDISSVALSYIHYWGLGKKNRKFKVGLGARLTSSFGGSSTVYQTAEAKLTSGKTGPSVFFAEQITQNIDTLQLNRTQVNAINALIALHYDFSPKWGGEFNIDLLGLSFGGNQDATLSYGDGLHGTRKTTASPTTGNFLLISDNDIGSLNSELMIFYQWKPRLKLKAGLSFLFNEYTIDDPVTYTNSIGTVIATDRYRVKSLAFAIGVQYGLKKWK
jgi:hypothetical protein